MEPCSQSDGWDFASGIPAAYMHSTLHWEYQFKNEKHDCQTSLEDYTKHTSISISFVNEGMCTVQYYLVKRRWVELKVISINKSRFKIFTLRFS